MDDSIILIPLLLLVIFVTFFMGMFAGNSMIMDSTRKEIEEYNSIRIDGVYYYPEEVINNENIR